MKDNTVGNPDEMKIDLIKYLRILWSRIVAILLAGAVFAAGFYAYARMFVSPRYEANALFFVNNSSISISGSLRVSASDISAASGLVNTIVAILQSRANMELVIEESGVNYNYEQLRNMVSAKAENSSGLFRIYVNAPNPEEARTIANAVAVILPEKVSDIIENVSVEVVDYAVTPRSRVSPNYILYAEGGFLLGVVISSALVLLFNALDTIIHDEDYITRRYSAPLLSAIPDLTERSQRKYGYGYESASGKTRS